MYLYVNNEGVGRQKHTEEIEKQHSSTPQCKVDKGLTTKSDCLVEKQVRTTMLQTETWLQSVCRSISEIYKGGTNCTKILLHIFKKCPELCSDIFPGDDSKILKFTFLTQEFHQSIM